MSVRIKDLPYRLQQMAIDNARKQLAIIKRDTSEQAMLEERLCTAFLWGMTVQGNEFWRNIELSYSN